MSTREPLIRKSIDQQRVDDAVRIIIKVKGKKIADAFWRMNTPFERERENAAGILRRDSKIPKSIINYVVHEGNVPAIEKALVMVGDLLDPEYGRVRPQYAKEYERIKERFRGGTNPKAQARKELKTKVTAKKDIVGKHLQEKRAEAQKAKQPKFDFSYSKTADEIMQDLSKVDDFKGFQANMNAAMEEAESNPEGMDEEKIEATGKTLLSYDLGVNIDVYKEILRNIRDSALEFSNSQKACDEVANCARELTVMDPDDVNGIAAGLVRLLTAARVNASKMGAELNSLQTNNQALSLEVAQLNQRASKAETDAADLNNSISTKNMELAKVIGQMQVLQKTYDSTQNELASARRKITENEADFTNKIQAKQEEALVMQQQYNDLDVNKKKLEREIENLKFELDDKNKEVDKVRAQLVVYESTNKDLASVDLQKAAKIEKLNGDIAVLNNTVSQLQKDLAFKEDEYAQKASIKDKEIQDLQLDKEKWLAQKAEMDQLAAKNGELTAQIESLENQKEALNKSLKEKDEANAVLRAKGIASAEAQEELTKERINAKAVIADLNNQVNELKEQVKLNNAKAVDFQAKYESVSSKLTSAEKELESAKQVNNIVKNDYDDAQKTIGILQGRVKGYETQLSTEAKLRVEAQEECTKAQIRCSQARADNIKLRVAKDKAQSEVVALKSKLEDLEKLKAENFVVANSIQDDEGDIAMGDRDAQAEVTAVLTTQQEDIPIPLPTVQAVLTQVAGPQRRKSTAPSSHPPTLAGKKRSLNKAGGAYLVGGRPDPDLARGSKFWKNAYNKSFKLF